jgi:hypothetical protein
MRVRPLVLLASLTAAACSAEPRPSRASALAPGSAPRLIGIHAFGTQADLARLGAFATQSGFPGKQMDAPEGRELVIAFPPNSSPSAVAAFIGRLRTEFSSMTFKSAYAPAHR